MDISTKAMLSTVSIGYWTGRASDERVIDEIAQKHSSERDMHEYRKVLIKPEALNLIKAARSRARTYWMEETLPWLDGGTRVLPAVKYEGFAVKMRELKAEFEGAVKEFIQGYDLLKAEARRRLNGLYREEDYPPKEGLVNRFKFDVNVFPIPSANDWRVSLGKEAQAELERSTDTAIAKAAEIMSRDVWRRLHEVVAAMTEAMKKEKPNFRASILSNIQEVVAMLPDLNVTDDPHLTKMSKDITAMLKGLDPEMLRGDPLQRKKVAKNADDILRKMKGYVGS
jgi:hypothetical protein